MTEGLLNEDQAKRYANTDSAGFCMKSERTRDRCNVKNLPIITWFVCNSMPEEHLIGLLDLHQLDAEYMSPEKLRQLSDAGYSAASRVMKVQFNSILFV